MRILLINPPVNSFTGLIKRRYPIGLCMLDAVVKQEKVDEVKVYDVDKSIPNLFYHLLIGLIKNSINID